MMDFDSRLKLRSDGADKRRKKLGAEPLEQMEGFFVAANCLD